MRVVSRSFAFVVDQLVDELRPAVCIFYLVLRALDTLEDDMCLSYETKLAELPLFADVFLKDSMRALKF